jgi:hypothetical protein
VTARALDSGSKTVDFDRGKRDNLVIEAVAGAPMD